MIQETVDPDKMNQHVKTSFQLNDVRREKSLVNVPKKESRRNVKRHADSAVSSRRKGIAKFCYSLKLVHTTNTY